MIYQHKYFRLNTEDKKVFDENGKELRLTGNAYRMLVFLCEKKNANVTEIGDFLDWARDYEENHLRQYRYKINSIIGRDVIEYKNGVYSLVGEAREVQKMAENDRNTDLLHSDQLKLSSAGPTKAMKQKNILKVPGIIAVVMLFLTFFNWPYAYYTLLRIVVTLAALYYAYVFGNLLKKYNFWFWAMLAIAVVFNPLIPIYLKQKGFWILLDLISIVIFLGFIFNLKKQDGKY